MTNTFKAGQEVFVLRAHGPHRLEPIYSTTVTKVGRTRVTVEDGRYNTQFYIDGGAEVHDPAQVRIMTAEQLADARRREELMKEIDANRFQWSRLTIDEIETIRDLVVAARKRGR